MTDTTKRKGRGKSAKNVKLIDEMHSILQRIQPASVRAVCYQLFIKKLIPSMSKKETGAVGTQLKDAREMGLIPWAWVVDETRDAETISTWADPDSVIRAAVSQYRKDYWSMQPRRVEVWSEKGTIRGTIAPVLEKYGVTLRVMHGFTSATSAYDAAQNTLSSDKSMTILYCGDWDPSGLCMSDVDLPKRLDRYGGRAEIVRVALDETDVDQGSTLPFFDAEEKTSDSRYNWFVKNHGSRCWELDCLAPNVLRDRLDDAISCLLDIDAWNHAIKIERAEVESMQGFMATWKSISHLGDKYSEGGAA